MRPLVGVTQCRIIKVPPLLSLGSNEWGSEFALKTTKSCVFLMVYLMKLEGKKVSFECIYSQVGTNAVPTCALCQGVTYVELPWQTCPVRWTGASDAAHHDHCLSGQSEQWVVSDWLAGGTGTSLRRSVCHHRLEWGRWSEWAIKQSV